MHGAEPHRPSDCPDPSSRLLIGVTPAIPPNECAAIFELHNGENPQTYVVRFGMKLHDFVLCDGCVETLRETFEAAEKMDPVPAFDLFPSRRHVERTQVPA